MPRGDQVGRLYTIVMSLAATRRGLTAAMLAKKYDLPLRTVYRDLDALEQAGFPVTKLDGGRWKLIDGWDQKIPFPLSAGELLALHIAADVMAPLAATPAGKQLAKLHRRLTGGKPRRRSAQSELFPGMPSILHLPAELEIDYDAYDHIIEPLWKATEDRRTLRGYYSAASSQEEGWRTIDPYVLHYDPKLAAMYVIGWCHERRDLRTFAVHRFQQVEITEAEFARPVSFDLERYLAHSFGIWTAKETIDVRLRVHPPSAAWVKERRWHRTQKTREHGDGTVDLELTVADTVEIVRWILGFGADVEVLAPPELREEVREIHRLAASGVPRKQKALPGKRSVRRESQASSPKRASAAP